MSGDLTQQNVSSFEMSSTLFSSDWPFGIDLPLKSAYDRLRLRANKNPIIIIITVLDEKKSR
jgi:hypothetical protein